VQNISSSEREQAGSAAEVMLKEKQVQRIKMSSSTEANNRIMVYPLGSNLFGRILWGEFFSMIPRAERV